MTSPQPPFSSIFTLKNGTVASAKKTTVPDRAKAFCKALAHLVYFKTLNLTFSASGQNIKNLVSNFGAIHVAGIMHAKF